MDTSVPKEIEEILASFRAKLAVIEERHRLAVKEILERIRQRRLAELKEDITPRT